ncbi:hypothetical protein OG883_31860 [Streptomyces sp. NBC_01142]|nr:hypothetical protein [Streptomyces sp. NBC_01142]MCX4824372.1 hypothetical protein [Streptomyces sp. NBC_01142]
MTITLAEEIMLLSLDDESGSAKQRQAAGWAVYASVNGKHRPTIR